MRPKLQKQSALKLAGRIILQSGGYNIPQLALGFHTRDLTANEKNNYTDGESDYNSR